MLGAFKLNGISKYIVGGPAVETDFLMTITLTGTDFTINCDNVGVFNATIDWDDASSSTITTNNDADLSHTYASSGTYQIRISGTFPSINMFGAPTASKNAVTSVDNLGEMGWLRLYAAFGGCENMTDFTAGNTDTSAVNSTQFMFYNCFDLATTDLNLNTSSVISMGYMFYDCNSLTSLDLSTFDTSAVINMQNMFYACNNVTTIDVTSFDTGLVQNMESMFGDNWYLTTLDVTGFDTSNVTLMRYMFYQCYYLSGLDLSNFNTSAVTNMQDMFYYYGFYTGGVPAISTFNIEAVTNYGRFMTNSSTTTANYDAILIAWDALNPVDNLTVDFGASTYTGGGAAATARASLISTDSWTITDGGIA